jgi:hypothetical protein
MSDKTATESHQRHCIDCVLVDRAVYGAEWLCWDASSSTRRRGRRRAQFPAVRSSSCLSDSFLRDHHLLEAPLDSSPMARLPRCRSSDGIHSLVSPRALSLAWPELSLSLPMCQPLTPVWERGRLESMVVACTLGASIPARSNLTRNLASSEPVPVCGFSLISLWCESRVFLHEEKY